MADNYYERLGVKREADFSEIRKAYRTLVLDIHPDRNPLDETAKEKFQLLIEAYEVLSDPKKRVEYDLTLPGKTQSIPPAVFAKTNIWDQKGRVSSRKSLAYLYEQNINAFKAEDAWRAAFLSLILVIPVWNFFSLHKLEWWWAIPLFVLLFILKPVIGFLFIRPFVKEVFSFLILGVAAKIFLGEFLLVFAALTSSYMGAAVGAATGRAFFQASTNWKSKTASAFLGAVIGLVFALFIGFVVGMFRAMSGVELGFFNELFATALSGAIASFVVSAWGSISDEALEG